MLICMLGLLEPLLDPYASTMNRINPGQVQHRATFTPPKLDRSKSVTFLPSQDSSDGDGPVPYTGSPFALLWEDIMLVLSVIKYSPGIVLPWNMFSKDPLDELCIWSFGNILSVVVHTWLVFTQLFFLFSLMLCHFPLFIVPAWAFFAYFTFFFCFNHAFCHILNGFKPVLESAVGVPKDLPYRHSDEYWLYLNGVSVG